MEWQPIDTAPKDGTYVLLWGTDVACVVARFDEYDIKWWHVHDGRYMFYPLRGQAPTHWMTLPSPPVLKIRPNGKEQDNP